jgi:GTPase SAR1 family protein
MLETPRLFAVGGGQAYRQHWHRFLDNTSVLIYVVDSADIDRLDESSKTLWALLEDKQLNDVPILIVFNKQDVEGAKRPEELAEQFRLSEIVETRTVRLASCQVPPEEDETGSPEVLGVAQIKQLIISLCEVE